MPQMGPLPWVMLLLMVMSLATLMLTMVYFLPAYQFYGKKGSSLVIDYKWLW